MKAGGHLRPEQCAAVDDENFTVIFDHPSELALSTGESVHGFVCEADDVEEALDISHHGGWRANLPARSCAKSAVPIRHQNRLEQGSILAYMSGPIRDCVTLGRAAYCGEPVVARCLHPLDYKPKSRMKCRGDPWAAC